ncbi:THAP domain-containing protein 3 [Exaiptasia diaphana]|nr:THAP domain-containing protein 3 [Exaiptasia diaphana]
MPQNCCVPQCTKKVYIENGVRISYHRFPDNKDLFKQWMIAIRRDLGRDFQVTAHTRVCSRHFKLQDFKLSFGGRKRTLLPEAVPSVFPWKQGSPPRRKSPRKRIPIEDKTKKNASNNAATTANEDYADRDEVPTQIEESEVCSVNNSEPIQETFDNYEELKKENNRLLHELSRAIEVQEELRAKIEMLEQQTLDLKSKLFTADNLTKSDKDVAFYTGFPTVHVFQSVYEFLDPGEQGEHLIYWHSTPDTTNENASEYNAEAPKQGRPRQLSTKDEYFMVLCRLRQGFREHHLSHLFNVSQTTISRIVISWINFMFLRLCHRYLREEACGVPNPIANRQYQSSSKE